MNKKLLWILIGTAVLLLGLWGLKAGGIIGKEEGIKVAVEKADFKTIIQTVNASGKVYPEIEVKVSPDISGEIVELTVAEGDTVKKGQVVARIFADLLSSQRDQVAAGVSQAKAQLSNTNASLDAFKASVEQTKAAYDRQKKLLDEKVISRAEFEQAEQAYKSATANYNAARENLKSGEASIQSAQAQLNRADKDLGRTVIVAPMDGVVSLLSVKKGEKVAGNSFNVGTEMMRIADMRSIEVRVDVGENDIPKVKIGDTALVEIDAYTNRKVKGIVYKIANPSSTSSITGAATSTEVTNYKVHIRLLPDSYADLIKPGKAFPFRPNMSASADIQTQIKSNIMAISLNAVTTRDKEKPAKDSTKKETTNNNTINADGVDEVVFIVQKDNTVKKVIVKTAIQDINNIEITSGLQKGDLVVVAPYNTVSKLLKQGDKVQVVEKDKLFESDDKKN